MENRQLIPLALNLILECRRSLKVKGAELITSLSQKEEKKEKRKLAGSDFRYDQNNKKKNIRNKQSAYTD